MDGFQANCILVLLQCNALALHCIMEYSETPEEGRHSFIQKCPLCRTKCPLFRVSLFSKGFTMESCCYIAPTKEKFSLSSTWFSLYTNVCPHTHSHITSLQTDTREILALTRARTPQADTRKILPALPPFLEKNRIYVQKRIISFSGHHSKNMHRQTNIPSVHVLTFNVIPRTLCP